MFQRYELIDHHCINASASRVDITEVDVIVHLPSSGIVHVLIAHVLPLSRQCAATPNNIVHHESRAVYVALYGIDELGDFVPHWSCAAQTWVAVRILVFTSSRMRLSNLESIQIIQE
jgi:hypothetical protein